MIGFWNRPALMTASLLLATLAPPDDVLAQGAQTEEVVSRLFIGADKVKEVCLELKSNESLVYNFQASGSLLFNLHYHKDGKLLFPVANSLTTAASNQFNANIENTYCLMWTNKSVDPIDLTLGIRKR